MRCRLFLTGVLAFLLGACAPVSKEKPRFLWIDASANFRSYGNDADSIGRDCKRIAEMGFTDIVVDVRPTSGDVLFASSVAPALRKVPGWIGNGWGFRERTADFDYLQAFIDAGHAAGLKVHAGVNVMVGGWKAPGLELGMVYDRPERQEWCAVDYRTDGLLVNHALDTATVGGRFLDPANPEVQAFALDMLAELAAYEDLDGIVMDRCRYDDYAMDAGYTEAGRRAFSAFLGREPERWPVFTEPGHIFLDKEPDVLETAWLTFRCRVIHDFVARAILPQRGQLDQSVLRPRKGGTDVCLGDAGVPGHGFCRPGGFPAPRDLLSGGQCPWKRREDDGRIRPAWPETNRRGCPVLRRP